MILRLRSVLELLVLRNVTLEELSLCSTAPRLIVYQAAPRSAVPLYSKNKQNPTKRSRQGKPPGRRDPHRTPRCQATHTRVTSAAAGRGQRGEAVAQPSNWLWPHMRRRGAVPATGTQCPHQRKNRNMEPEHHVRSLQPRSKRGKPKLNWLYHR